jgi:glutathionyl-hydroquinone reductase
VAGVGRRRPLRAEEAVFPLFETLDELAERLAESAIADYEHLSGYLRDLYQTPGVAETVDIAQIQRHYYVMHHSIKPNGIVPAGPELDFSSPHGRERL